VISLGRERLIKRGVGVFAIGGGGGRRALGGGRLGAVTDFGATVSQQ